MSFLYLSYLRNVIVSKNNMSYFIWIIIVIVVNIGWTKTALNKENTNLSEFKKKSKIYLIMLLWLVLKHSFVVYLYKEHNARISSCAWNTFYLHFAYYVWMLWYRSLTLCQMKQLWTVISISYLILGVNSLLHGPHKHPYTADHSWSIYSLLSCIWTRIRMSPIRHT